MYNVMCRAGYAGDTGDDADILVVDADVDEGSPPAPPPPRRFLLIAT
jgi:hypothetical protein